MGIDIRPLKAEDKAAVMAIFRSLPEFNQFDVSTAEELCDAFLREGAGSGYYALVAVIGASVVGYICYGPTPLTEGTWDIYWAAVAPDRQRQGVGRRLFTFVEEELWRAKARIILIETSGTPLYERTRLFHQSMGYEEICRIPDFYLPGDDKVVLWKRQPGK